MSRVDFQSRKLHCIEQSCLVEVYAREGLSACRHGPTTIICCSAVLVCQEKKDGERSL